MQSPDSVSHAQLAGPWLHGSLFISLNWKEKAKIFKLLGGVAPADIPHLSMSSGLVEIKKGFRLTVRGTSSVEVRRE